jgi:hypothetical protein
MTTVTDEYDASMAGRLAKESLPQQGSNNNKKCVFYKKILNAASHTTTHFIFQAQTNSVRHIMIFLAYSVLRLPDELRLLT